MRNTLKLTFRRLGFLLLLFLAFCKINAQSYYYPPKTGLQWDTISPNRLGWCEDSIQQLTSFLQTTNTKSFIILKDGKIVMEKYFGTFTKDSSWYWASAGKTIASSLVGIAQHEGLLDIDDSSSKYLGQGWSSCTPLQESKITIKNHLTMTTGLDENIPDQDCKTPACLKYKADAGSRWYYYNAPYLLLHDIIASASGVTLQQYTNTRLLTKIGMSGLWFNGVFFSKTRDMAKFGSMILNKGIWESDTIIKDRSYFQQMQNTSQNLNLSYGYLFWLNGKASAMVPQSSIVFNQSLFPNSPSDMFAALGKNDQKVYIVPSQNLVVIRMGNSAGPTSFGPSGFDNQLWLKISNLTCATSLSNTNNSKFKIYPNPFDGKKLLINSLSSSIYEIFDFRGLLITNGKLEIGLNELQLNLNSGFYYIKSNGESIKLVVE
ncbi:MAG: serine hydrolase [Bacteroidota bacterium]|nr:serine hydrolase [Bacteroidota bacterium]